MADSKFDTKAHEVFVLLQNGGTAKTYSDFHSHLNSVVPTSDAKYSPSNPSQEMMFGGDPNERDGYSWLTDELTDLTFKLFVPRLEFDRAYGALGTGTGDYSGVTGDNIPLSRIYQASNAAVLTGDIQATPTASKYNIPETPFASTIPAWLASHWTSATPTNYPAYCATNAATNSELASIAFQQVSIDAVNNSFTPNAAETSNIARFYVFTGCKAQLDLDIEIGSPAMWSNIKFMGNWNAATREQALAPNYSLETSALDQKLLQGTRFDAKSIIICEVQPLAGTFASDTKTVATAGEITSDEMLVSEAGWKNICISKLSAPNFFGFDFQRQLLSCENAYSENGISTDLTITKRLGHVADGFDSSPQINGTTYVDFVDTFDAENHKKEYFKFRIMAGSKKTGFTIFQWDKIQLDDITPTTIGTNEGQDLKFKNRGKCHFISIPPCV